MIYHHISSYIINIIYHIINYSHYTYDYICKYVHNYRAIPQPLRLRSSCWQPLFVATKMMARTERRPRLGAMENGQFIDNLTN